MNIIELLIAGVQGLTDHLFRTFLTMLGIVFGVAAVISMVSIGAGAEKEAIEELRRFGTDSIRLNSRTIEGEPLKEAIRLFARGLSLSDAEFLGNNCPFIRFAVPEKVTDAKVYVLRKKPMAKVTGVGDSFLLASRFELQKGRFLFSEDISNKSLVAVLGEGVAKEIFGDNESLGEIIQIDRLRFTVVGVMKKQGTSSGKLAIKSRDHDMDVYIPITTAIDRLPVENPEDKKLYHEVSALWITVHENIDIIAARDAIVKIIKRRHREIDDFETLVPLEILRQSQKTQQLFNLVMALIAGISLLVGGIGIMNIMLASVNERTREIGVRRAMGASKRDIIAQFLTESTLISLAGGLSGILVGIILSLAISYYTGWTTVIPLSSVFIAFVVSVTVGIIFGAFPAVKASELDPVTALRYE
ncbi:MAG: ABC transporter permease [Candidatus Riflebacteria bacterium]|nr:ABC transporter permease [Candidatus Riflebacteria bacterium]